MKLFKRKKYPDPQWDLSNYDKSRKPMRINKIRPILTKEVFDYYMKNGFKYL
jgi:hypothetical protein